MNISIAIQLGSNIINSISLLLKDFMTFKLRVLADGGTVEGETAALQFYDSINGKLTPVLAASPYASKASKFYSLIGGDFTVVRATTPNRINELGQTVVVPANVPVIDWTNGYPELLVTSSVISNTTALTELQPYTVIENNDAYVVPKFPNSEFFLNQKRFKRLIIEDSITDAKITELGATKHTCIWASRLIANDTFTINVRGTGVVHWGDGTTSSYNNLVSNVTLTKVYSNFNGVIYVTGTLIRIEILNLNLRHNIASLPSGLTFYYNAGLNTTSGSISSLPTGLTIYQNFGSNTTSGSIASLPSGLTFYYNTGLNTTSGSISSLPSGLTFYYNAGSNTTSGSIASLPSGLTYYFNAGSNTTSGNIASLPTGLTFYFNAGSNTTSGNIASLPTGLTFYFNTGSNQVNQYTAGRVWANNMERIHHNPAVGFGLTSTMVDNLLIDLANVATWTGSKLINLAGNNAPRTAASTTAINTLVSKGVSVTTN